MSTEAQVYEFNIDLDKLVEVNAAVDVTHKPGAVKLEDFPLLAYAPIQHGPGIRTEDNGTPVADLCNALAVNPDVEAVASKFGTTADHVRQAHDYAIAHLPK